MKKEKFHIHFGGSCGGCCWCGCMYGVYTNIYIYIMLNVSNVLGLETFFTFRMLIPFTLSYKIHEGEGTYIYITHQI